MGERRGGGEDGRGIRGRVRESGAVGRRCQEAWSEGTRGLCGRAVAPRVGLGLPWLGRGVLMKREERGAWSG